MRQYFLRYSALAASLAVSPVMQAYELYSDGSRSLNLDVNAMFGMFHSQRSYAAINPDTRTGTKSWREGSLQYGFSGEQRLVDDSEVSFGLSWVGTGTWGDGDAAGITNGKERRTHIEDAWLSWKSGQLVPMLGDDGVEVSFGRQTLTLGNGFLVYGDPVSMGKGVEEGALNRGGAYYLAPRNSFGSTGVLSLGGAEGWRGDLIYLKSSNPAQAKTELNIYNLEHVSNGGTLGASFIKGQDVNKNYADDLQLARKGMKTYSLRGNNNFGIKNLDLSVEYVRQNKKRSENAKGWYTQASWTFFDRFLQPTLTYRYSRFSKHFDPLFYGLSSGFGTWFQGEVAGNYAGPFNNNNSVHHAGLNLAVNDDLALGALAFKFKTLNKNEGDLSGKELNVFAEWSVNKHLSVVPVVGWYKPKKNVFNNGAQLRDRKNNFYSQVLFIAQF